MEPAEVRSIAAGRRSASPARVGSVVRRRSASPVGSVPSTPRSARSSRSSGPPTTTGATSAGLAERVRAGHLEHLDRRILACQPPLTRTRSSSLVEVRLTADVRPERRDPASPGTPPAPGGRGPGRGRPGPGEVVAHDQVGDPGPSQVRRQPGRASALGEPSLDRVEHPDVARRGRAGRRCGPPTAVARGLHRLVPRRSPDVVAERGARARAARCRRRRSVQPVGRLRASSPGSPEAAGSA